MKYDIASVRIVEHQYPLLRQTLLSFRSSFSSIEQRRKSGDQRGRVEHHRCNDTFGGTMNIFEDTAQAAVSVPPTIPLRHSSVVAE